MRAIIECEKGTRKRFEKASSGEIEFKCPIKHKWVEAYGFIEGTLQADGDELDAYILGRKLKKGEAYDVEPICMIICYDDSKSDDKMVCLVKGQKASRNIDKRVKRIIHAVAKYKKGNVVMGAVYGEVNLQYEALKCSLYKKMFGKEAK